MEKVPETVKVFQIPRMAPIFAKISNVEFDKDNFWGSLIAESKFFFGEPLEISGGYKVFIGMAGGPHIPEEHWIEKEEYFKRHNDFFGRNINVSNIDDLPEKFPAHHVIWMLGPDNKPISWEGISLIQDPELKETLLNEYQKLIEKDQSFWKSFKTNSDIQNNHILYTSMAVGYTGSHDSKKGSQSQESIHCHVYWLDKEITDINKVEIEPTEEISELDLNSQYFAFIKKFENKIYQNAFSIIQEIFGNDIEFKNENQTENPYRPIHFEIIFNQPIEPKEVFIKNEMLYLKLKEIWGSLKENNIPPVPSYNMVMHHNESGLVTKIEGGPSQRGPAEAFFRSNIKLN